MRLFIVPAEAPWRRRMAMPPPGRLRGRGYRRSPSPRVYRAHVKLRSSPEPKAFVEGDCVRHEWQGVEKHTGRSKIPSPVKALGHQRASDAATPPVRSYSENSQTCPTRREAVPVLGAVRIEIR